MIVDLAGPEDDPEIRRLLRDNPMDGAIQVSLEREPDAFQALDVEGELYATVVARDRDTGRIVGLGTRSVAKTFINGEIRRLGYLSQLRLDRAARGKRRVLAAGFAALRELRGPEEAPFDVAAIIADNEPARRLLGAGVPGLPRFRELSGFVTLVLPVLRSSHRPAGVRIEPGHPDRMEEVAECLARNHRRFQLAPFFTASELLSPERSRGLAARDFQLAVGEDGRVAGCLALWDQRGFKQAVIRGYAPRLARWRPWINRLSRFLGTPQLPDPGEALRQAYIAHVAIDGDDPEIFQALLEAAYAEARTRGLAYVILGLAAGHPWLPWIERRFRPRRYVSVLYTVDWGDGGAAVEALDGRLPHVEAARL